MRTKLSGIAALAMVLVLAACAGKNSEGERITGEPPPETSSTTAPSTQDATPLAVTATELENDQIRLELPTRAIQGGRVAVTLLNVGTKTHDISLVKLADGDFEKFSAAVELEGLAAALAAHQVVAGPIEARSGDQATETLTLEPGVYAVMSTGTAMDGRPFAEHGAVTKLTVEPPEATATDDASE